jgi:hypothetical protein
MPAWVSILVIVGESDRLVAAGGDLDLLVRCQLDVGRLEVAVDDAALVRLLEAGRDLQRDPKRLVEREPAALDPLLQRLALDQFHHQEVNRRSRLGMRRLLDGMDAGDVGMVQRRQHLRLAGEAGHPRGIVGEGLRQQLQRDVAAELRVPGAVDRAHAALAELVGHAEMSQVSINHEHSRIGTILREVPHLHLSG